MDGDADGPRVVGDGARDGLANPPRGIRAELEAAAPVEFFDGTQEAQVAFLDEVDQRHAAVGVAAGDADHQPQVRLGQRGAGRVAFGGGVLELVAHLLRDGLHLQALHGLATAFDRLR